MMRTREAFQSSTDPTTRSVWLGKCVRQALGVRRARLHAVIACAALASVTPLALGETFEPVFPLSSLYPAGGGDGSRGFVLAGIHAYDRSGSSVSSAGDVNGDGIDDVIIGAYGADTSGNYAGESYVVFGSAEGFPAVVQLASLYPPGGGDGSRGVAGDVNGDGIDDVVIGARNAAAAGVPFAGESYVVFGQAAAP